MMLTLKNSVQFFKKLAACITIRRDNATIETIAELERFVCDHAAFVAQKTLYGYLKARMGTRYPILFEDDIFVGSINLAKFHIFAECLSDLMIFALLQIFGNRNITREAGSKLALSLYNRAIETNRIHAPDGFSVDEYGQAFSQRLQTTLWDFESPQDFEAFCRNSFIRSPAALVKWSPIAPELKKYDIEIIENSIKFKWNEVQRQFLKRLNDDKVYDDWCCIVSRP